MAGAQSAGNPMLQELLDKMRFDNKVSLLHVVASINLYNLHPALETSGSLSGGGV